jgi:RND family efflux transporter MFP subunit
VTRLGYFVCVAALWLTGCASQANKPAPMQAPPPAVTIAVARTMDVPIEVRQIGTTEAPEVASLRPRVTGFIEQRLFTEGSDVQKDDLLFVIDEKPFKVQLDIAEAALADAQANLNFARRGLNIQSAQAKLTQDLASLDLAKLEVVRFKDLVTKSAASQQQVDEKQTRAQELSAMVDADKAALGQAELLQKTDIERAQARLQSAKADRENALLNLGYCRIHAPLGGRIGAAQVDAGNLVSANSGEILATIQQIDPIDVQWQINGKLLPTVLPDYERLKKELGVRITVSDNYVYPHPGRAYFIDNTVDPETSTFTAKARFPNPDKVLLPGLYAQIRLRLGERKGVVVVPERAVILGNTGSTVYVVDGENKVRKAAVETSINYEGLRVIEKGISAGDRVIIEGAQLIRPGITVNPLEEAPVAETKDREKPPDYPLAGGPLNKDAAKPEPAPEPAKEAPKPEPKSAPKPNGGN